MICIPDPAMTKSAGAFTATGYGAALGAGAGGLLGWSGGKAIDPTGQLIPGAAAAVGAAGLGLAGAGAGLAVDALRAIMRKRRKRIKEAGAVDRLKSIMDSPAVVSRLPEQISSLLKPNQIAPNGLKPSEAVSAGIAALKSLPGRVFIDSALRANANGAYRKLSAIIGRLRYGKTTAHAMAQSRTLLKPRIWTEKDLTMTDRQALRRLIHGRKTLNDQLLRHTGGDLGHSKSISYPDYSDAGDPNGNGNGSGGSIATLISSPMGRLKYTLGNFAFKDQPKQDVTISDIYDFGVRPKGEAYRSTTVYNRLRDYAHRIMPDTDNQNASRFELNLGKYDPTTWRVTPEELAKL